MNEKLVDYVKDSIDWDWEPVEYDSLFGEDSDTGYQWGRIDGEQDLLHDIAFLLGIKKEDDNVYKK